MAVLATAVISGRIHSPTARVFCMADVTALMAVVREGASEADGSAKNCGEKGSNQGPRPNPRNLLRPSAILTMCDFLSTNGGPFRPMNRCPSPGLNSVF
jgi:hypothetical protein